MRLTSFFFVLSLQGVLGVFASSNPPETSDIVEIWQTVNLFGVLVDTAQYDQMGRVFTANTSVDFALPGVGILHGLAAVEKEVSIVANVTSQHSLTTYHVDFLGPRNANVISYIIGTFFGQGLQAGQTFIVYGTLVRHAAYVESRFILRIARYYIEMLLVDVGWRVNTLTLKPTSSQLSDSSDFADFNRS